MRRQSAALRARPVQTLTAEDLQSGRYLRISQIQRLQNAGRLDSSLRWMQQPAEAVVA